MFPAPPHTGNQQGGKNVERLMKTQLCVHSENATDDYLLYLRSMGLSHCFVMFSNEHSNYEDVNRAVSRTKGILPRTSPTASPAARSIWTRS